jgi:hypothetical protein
LELLSEIFNEGGIKIISLSNIRSIIIYFHSSQCRLIPYLHQRPIFFQNKLIYCRHFRTYSRCAMFDWSDTVFWWRNVMRRRISNTVLQPRYWGREADSPEVCRLAACLTSCKYPFPLKSFHFWIFNDSFNFYIGGHFENSKTWMHLLRWGSTFLWSLVKIGSSVSENLVGQNRSEKKRRKNNNNNKKWCKNNMFPNFI